MTSIELIVLFSLFAAGMIGFIVSVFQKKPTTYPPPSESDWIRAGSKLFVKDVPEFGGAIEESRRRTFSPGLSPVYIRSLWRREGSGVTELFFYVSMRFFSRSPFDSTPMYVVVNLPKINSQTVITNRAAAAILGLERSKFVDKQLPLLSRHSHIYTDSGVLTIEAKRLEGVPDLVKKFVYIERFEDVLILSGRHGFRAESLDQFFDDVNLVKKTIGVGEGRN